MNVQIENRVVLKTKHTTIWSLPGKAIMFVLGCWGIMLGVIICFTVVGLLVGIPMILGGMSFIYASMNRQKVTCPHCQHSRNYVPNRALNFRCRKCRQLTLVDWDK